MLTDDARYAALATRDPRFDGVFFVGVSTTGIYCRPICPARTPGRARCTFYASPAQAEAAGYRACFRCRPELAPGARANVPVDAIDALVAAATQRIAEGALNDGSVEALAAGFGVSARHLRRAIELRLGVSPVELAQSRRLALAKQLLQDTALSITEIAFAAGFGSVRRFNAVFGERLGVAPRDVRRAHPVAPADGGVTLRLDHRAPYAWGDVLGFLRVRAIPGVEHVSDDRTSIEEMGSDPSYARVVRLAGHTGVIRVRRDPDRSALRLEVSPALLPVLMPVVARVRRLFDLDAHPDQIARVLRRDRALAPLVARRPGLRVPGAVDPFEASVRALLGQQVSVAAATTLAGRFAAAFGAAVVTGDPRLTHRFPAAGEVAQATPAAIAAIGLPIARATALHGFAAAVARGELRLDGATALEPFVAQVVALPGIGPWTAHYLAMRALHVPDAFPSTDLGVVKAIGGTPREIAARGEAWRPFRSYAVMYLWSSLGGPDAEDEDDRVADRAAAPRRARRAAGRRVHGRAGRAARDRGRRARARRGGAPARRVLRR